VTSDARKGAYLIIQNITYTSTVNSPLTDTLKSGHMLYTRQ